GMTTAQIAENLDMSIRVVQRTLHIWQEIGNVVKDPRTYAKRGKACLLDSGSVEFILALLEQQPDIYLDDIAEELLAQRNVSVSLSTIQRTLELLGVTSKKV
ncbi:hypothetical protein JB92DRAFT_2656744, partial [Gautieria morchelliformis]